MAVRATCQYCKKKRYSDRMVIINQKSEKNGKPEWACKSCATQFRPELPFEAEDIETTPAIAEAEDTRAVADPTVTAPEDKSIAHVPAIAEPIAVPKDKKAAKRTAPEPETSKAEDKTSSRDAKKETGRGKASSGFAAVIQKGLQEMAASDPLFAKSLAKKGKNIEDCCTYILNTVKKSGNSALTDAEVFGMAAHYYDEDDIKVGSPVSAEVIHTKS